MGHPVIVLRLNILRTKTIYLFSLCHFRLSTCGWVCARPSSSPRSSSSPASTTSGASAQTPTRCRNTIDDKICINKSVGCKFILFFCPTNKLDPYSLSFSGFPQHADYDAEMCGDGGNRYPKQGKLQRITLFCAKHN